MLLISPCCSRTLTGISTGLEHDLLLELAQVWGAVKKQNAHGEYWVPTKPFLVAPRLPAERRNQLIIEKQMRTLEVMGLTVIADP